MRNWLDSWIVKLKASWVAAGRSADGLAQPAMVAGLEVSPELSALTDTGRFSRLAFWVLGVGFGGFAIWAAFVPLAEGVPTPGNVVIDTKRIPVQHASGGTVAQIFVKEGERVKSGQPLLRFNELQAKAIFEQAVGSLAALQENLKGQQAMVAALEKIQPAREATLKVLKKQLDGVSDLAAQGYAPQNQKLDLERSVSEAQSNLDDLGAQFVRAKQQVLETGHQIKVAQERLELAKRDLEKTTVLAPSDGQVVGMTVTNPGTVVASGQKMMDIVPEKESLVIEAEIMPNLIDRIRPGDPVDVMFMTFSHSPQLVVTGVLQTVSTDVLTDQRTGMPHYLARIAVTPEGLQELGKRQMQPGMPVQVVIKTGSRTLLAYLVAPLTRRISSSLKEE